MEIQWIAFSSIQLYKIHAIPVSLLWAAVSTTGHNMCTAVRQKVSCNMSPSIPLKVSLIVKIPYSFYVFSYHMRWAFPWHLKISRSMAPSHFKPNYSYTGVMESQKDLQLMDSNYPILQGTKTQRRYVIFFNRCFFKCLPCTVG